MAQKVKAHCWWVHPEEGNAEQIAEAMRDLVKKGAVLQLGKEKNPVVVCETKRSKAGGAEVFTGTAFKIRDGSLPSVIGADGPQRLELAPGTSLGEPMCFALDPAEGVLVLFRSPNGPMHTAVREAIAKQGFPHPVKLEPVLRADMMERLERTTFVKSLRFKLQGAPGRPDLAAAGLPVERAIELVSSVGGQDILIEISIGRRGRGLALDIVRKAARFLSQKGGEAVTQLALDASESDERQCETLDLLKARFEIDIEVADDLRELNREDCVKKLAKALREVVPAVRKQKPT